MLNQKDVQQIEESGHTVESVAKQLETFVRGIPFSNVVTTASIGNGIEEISEENQQKLVDLFEREKQQLELVKFVPASGAATRMFKFLHQFLKNYDPDEQTLNKYLSLIHI